MHHGPLWQFFLATFFVVFVAQRGATAALHLHSDAHALLTFAVAAQALAGAAVAVGIWLGRRWVLGPLVALGAIVAGTAVVEWVVLGLRPGVSVVGAVAGALIVTGGLAWLVRHEFRAGESNAERAARSANDPSER